MSIVYMATNTANGKMYIGITKRTLEERISSHIRESRRNNKRLFMRAINKYGESSFTWKVIATTEIESVLDILEREYIKIYNTTDRSHGYNLTLGGEGAFSFTDEYIESHLKGKNNPFYGHTHTEATRIKIASGNKKRIGPLHHFYGKVHPCKGTRRITCLIKCVQTGEVFKSVLHASSVIGISRQSISRSLDDGKIRKGYSFTREVEEWKA